MVNDTSNELSPDYVITGGDLVNDVMRGNFERSDVLFKPYTEMSKGFKMPVYNCIGNHVFFGYTKKALKMKAIPILRMAFASVILERLIMLLIIKIGILLR